MSDVKKLKSRVDIVDLLFKIGGSGGWAQPNFADEEVQVFCPFCEDRHSHKPAGRANELKQLYFCFNCGTGGDVIHLARRHLTDTRGEEVTFGDTLAWLEETFPEDR